MYPLRNWHKLKMGFKFKQKTWYCRHHLGLDKICPCGTEILMPFNGTIKKLHGTMGGNTIWIYPDDQDIVIRILHCQQVKRSGRYQEGDIIGWVGNTGLSRGNHAHIDISRHKVNIWNINNFIDPEKYNWKKTMKVDIKLLHIIYNELLLRIADPQSSGYLGMEENEVRRILGGSEERQLLIRLVEVARRIKANPNGEVENKDEVKQLVYLATKIN